MKMGMKNVLRVLRTKDSLSMEEWGNITSFTLSCWILLQLLAFVNRIMPSSDQEHHRQCLEFRICLQFLQCCCNYSMLAFYHLQWPFKDTVKWD